MRRRRLTGSPIARPADQGAGRGPGLGMTLLICMAFSPSEYGFSDGVRTWRASNSAEAGGIAKGQAAQTRSSHLQRWMYLPHTKELPAPGLVLRRAVRDDRRGSPRLRTPTATAASSRVEPLGSTPEQALDNPAEAPAPRRLHRRPPVTLSDTRRPTHRHPQISLRCCGRPVELLAGRRGRPMRRRRSAWFRLAVAGQVCDEGVAASTQLAGSDSSRLNVVMKTRRAPANSAGSTPGASPVGLAGRDVVVTLRHLRQDQVTSSHSPYRVPPSPGRRSTQRSSRGFAFRPRARGYGEELVAAAPQVASRRGRPPETARCGGKHVRARHHHP